MTYYTGIDVSLRSVSICVVDETGAIKLEAKVAAEVEVIAATLRRFSDEIRQVGFEAGTLVLELASDFVALAELHAEDFELLLREERTTEGL